MLFGGSSASPPRRKGACKQASKQPPSQPGKLLVDLAALLAADVAVAFHCVSLIREGFLGRAPLALIPRRGQWLRLAISCHGSSPIWPFQGLGLTTVCIQARHPSRHKGLAADRPLAFLRPLNMRGFSLTKHLSCYVTAPGEVWPPSIRRSGSVPPHRFGSPGSPQAAPPLGWPRTCRPPVLDTAEAATSSPESS